jgi:hypothetical protein
MARRQMLRGKLTIDSVIQADTDINRGLAVGCAVETLEGDGPPHRVYASADVDLQATVRVELIRQKLAYPFLIHFISGKGFLLVEDA